MAPPRPNTVGQQSWEKGHWALQAPSSPSNILPGSDVMVLSDVIELCHVLLNCDLQCALACCSYSGFKVAANEAVKMP